jgi:PilZ domain
MSGTLITEAALQTPARIRNLSATGFALTTTMPLRIGEAVVVKLRDVSVSGHVIRDTGTAYGIKIEGEIDLARLTQKPDQKNNFVVSNLHKISETAYRPRIKT